MIKTIYIAENSTDMFNEDIPALTTETAEEIPVSPSESASYPSELAFIANKSLVSFGTMAISVLLIVVLAIILKRRKQVKDASAREIFMDEEPETDSENSHDYDVSENKNNSKITTFGSVRNSILTFLEKTKDI